MELVYMNTVFLPEDIVYMLCSSFLILKSPILEGCSLRHRMLKGKEKQRICKGGETLHSAENLVTLK